MKPKDSIPRITQMYNGDPRIRLGVQRGSSEDFHATFTAPLQLKLGTGRIVLFLRWGMGAWTAWFFHQECSIPRQQATNHPKA